MEFPLRGVDTDFQLKEKHDTVGHWKCNPYARLMRVNPDEILF